MEKTEERREMRREEDGREESRGEKWRRGAKRRKESWSSAHKVREVLVLETFECV
jgi:hypothetical protein